MSRPVVERLENRLLLAVVSWISDADGFWDHSANWLDDQGVNRVPADGDDVIIERPDAEVTVTFRTGSLSVNSVQSTEELSVTGGTLGIEASSQTSDLSLSGSGILTGSGDLSVSGLFDWFAGTHSGTGTTIIEPGAELLMRGAGKTLSQRTINNSGTMTLTGGFTTTSDGLVINNLADGLFDFAVDNSFGTNTAADTTQFNNAGTLRKSAGASGATFGMPVNNTGVVEVLTGTFELSGSGSSHSAFQISADARLELSNTFAFNIGATSSGDGILEVTGGTTTIHGPVPIDNLYLAGGVLDGTGELTISGLFDWFAGTHTGTGTTIIEPGAELLMRGAGKTLSQRTINNSGTMTLTGGFTTTSDGLVINNLADGLFDFAVDTSFGTNTAADTTQFNNSGTLRKSAGASGATFGMPVNNTGVVEVLTGTFELSGSGSSHSAFQISADARLELSNTFAFNTGATSSGDGILEVTGGTTTIHGPLSVDNLSLSGFGILAGSGDLSVSGLFDWFAGTHTGTGTTIIEPGAELLMRGANKTLSQRTINNSGTMTLIGGFTTTSNGLVINNLADGIFDIASDTSFGTSSGANPPQFNNAGKLRKSIGNATSVLDLPLNNSGSMEVLSGTMRLTGDGSSSGEFVMATDARLELNGTFAIHTGATSSGAGLLQISGGTTTISGPVTVENLHFAAGQLTGSGELTVSGLFDWFAGTHTGTGTTIIEPGAELLMRGANKTLSQRTINNSGTMTLTAGFTTTSEGLVINNLVGGLFDFAVDTSFGTNFGATTTQFNNAGTLRKSVGNATATFGMPVNNAGIVEVLSGLFVLDGALANYNGAEHTLTGGAFRAVSSTLRIPGADIRVNAAGIELDGALARLERASLVNALAAIHTNAEGGSLVVRNNADLATVGSFNNSGSLTVGPGSTVTIQGDLQQASTGALLIAVGGTPASGRFGELHVTGTADLAGAFEVLLNDGFGPSLGEIYEVSTFAVREGDFETVRTPLLGIDPAFAVLRTDTTVVLNALVTASDLRTIPTDILVPAEARPGDEMTVQYTVENTSDRDALGDWVDSLYLSRDSVLDASDLLIARVPWSGGLVSQASYTQTITGILPADAEANYRVIVVADSRGFVPDTNRTNNRAVSPGVIRTRVPVLAVGDSVITPLMSGQDVFFRVDVPPGADVRIRASRPVDRRFLLYAGFGSLPTRSSYDYASTNPVAVEQEILLSGRSGAWYVLLHGAQGVNGSPEVTLSAELVEFEVSSFKPLMGDNAGQTTITVTGSGFSPTAQVSLVSASGTEHAAIQVLFQDRNTLFATLPLTGLTPGFYLVRVNQGFESDSGSQFFEVKSGGAPGQLTFAAFSPFAIRPLSSGMVTVQYTNTGDSDVGMPTLFMAIQSSVLSLQGPSRLLEGGGSNRVSFLSLAGQSAGVVPPDGGGSQQIAFQSTSTALSPPAIHEFAVMAISSNPGQASWSDIWPAARPALVPLDAWYTILNNFVLEVGPSPADLTTAASRVNAYLSQLGQTTGETDAILDFALMQADNALPGGPLVVSTDAASPATGLPLALTRAYMQPITDRFRMGPWGRGWTHAFDLTMAAHADGNRVLVGPGFQRLFEKVVLPTNDVYWRGVNGDLGIFDGQLYEPDGTVYTFLGPAGKLSRIRDVHGNEITLAYTDGLLTSLQHSNGDAFQLEYNVHGTVHRLTDHAGRVTTYTYDTSGEYLLDVLGPYGSSQYSYITGVLGPRAHALESMTLRKGTTTLFEYDDRGRLVRRSTPADGTSLNLVYNMGAVSLTDETGATTTLWHNASGQISRVVDAHGQLLDREYNQTEQLSRERLPGNLSLDFQYSPGGLPKSVTDPLGHTVSQTYRRGRDPVSILQTDKVPYGYRLSSLTDQLGRTTHFELDDFGNLTRIVRADGTVDEFSYDATGNLTRLTNARGQSTFHTHNARGQILRRDFPGGRFEEFVYDSRGNLVSAATPQGATIFTYDAVDRLTSVTYPNGLSLSYVYNSVGQIIRVTDQDGHATQYSYDAAARLHRLTDAAGALLVEYTYDAANRLHREDRGNGTWSVHTYDVLNRLLELTHHAADGSVNSFFRYEYDALSRRTSMTTGDGRWDYTYDAVGQLVIAAFESSNPDLPNQELIYEYDAAGNRISVQENTLEILYGVNERNQYTTVATASLTYDADGNLIGRSDASGITTWIYNVDGQLTGMVSPAGSWTYEYDALGNRIATIHNGQRTSYLIDPLGLADVLGEYDASGNLIARYAHGLGLEARVDSGGVTTFYDFDALGSAAGLSGPDGTYVNRYRYLPYGERFGPADELVANPFQFVGQSGVMTESNGLHFMRARFYDAGLGRFMSEDPIGHAGGVNLYNYTANQPTNAIDPSGMVAFVPVLFVLSAEALGGIGLAAVYATLGLGALVALDTIIDGEPVTEIDGEPVVDPIPLPLPAPALPGRARPRIQNWWDIIRQPPGRPSPGAWRSSLTPAGQSLVEAVLDSAIFEVVARAFTNQVNSFDPNDILGPVGFGPEGFVRTELPYPYTIRFENLAAATAPAQQVVITQQLDPDLDWDTFQLGDFGFGSVHIDLPEGRNFYNTRLDLTETLGVLVDFTAGLDSLTGVATWTLLALDPETLDLPMNPFLGLLPPNQTSPEGEGYVMYTIRAGADVTTGTRIDAEARIFFDANDPIDTPAIFNTIDVGPPSSSVNTLPAQIATESFTVSWSGVDDTGGSGVGSYTVYVSEDGGPYVPLVTDTTETSILFHGEFGRTYAFYSVATDFVGISELPPALPDATTFLQASQMPIITGPGITSDQRPLITWTAVQDAVGYEVWIGNQSTATNPFDQQTVVASSYQPDFDFGIGLFNLWVRALLPEGQTSSWSQQTNLRINTPSTMVPMPRLQNVAQPLVQWQTLPGAVSYDLWVDNLTTGTSQFVRNMMLTETFWVSAAELPLGTYRAWIRGIDALGLPARWANHAEFLVMAPPEVTSPLHPTFERRPTFEWEPVTGAEHYEVFIRDRNTGVTVYHETQIADTQWTPAADLPDGRYLWWALAVGENGFRSFWSPTTAIYIGGRTELLTPAGSTFSTTPVFTWTPVTGAVSYQLFVDRTDVPTGGIINLTGLTEASHTPTVPLPVGTYRAWVRAVSSSGELSLWSVQHTFSIVAAGTVDESEANPLVGELLVAEELFGAADRGDDQLFVVRSRSWAGAVETDYDEETELDQLMIEFAMSDFTLNGSGKASTGTVVEIGRI